MKYEVERFENLYERGQIFWAFSTFEQQAHRKLSHLYGATVNCNVEWFDTSSMMKEHPHYSYRHQSELRVISMIQRRLFPFGAPFGTSESLNENYMIMLSVSKVSKSKNFMERTPS